MGKVLSKIKDALMRDEFCERIVKFCCEEYDEFLNSWRCNEDDVNCMLEKLYRYEKQVKLPKLLVLTVGVFSSIACLIESLIIFSIIFITISLCITLDWVKVRKVLKEKDSEKVKKFYKKYISSGIKVIENVCRRIREKECSKAMI